MKGCTDLDAVLLPVLTRTLLNLVTLGQRSRSLLTSLPCISVLLCLIKMKFDMSLRYTIGRFVLKGYATPNVYTMFSLVFQLEMVKLIILASTCRFKYASLPRNRGLILLHRPQHYANISLYKPEMSSFITMRDFITKEQINQPMKNC